MRPLNRVAIVGLGLMGGSLGLAIRGLGLARCVAGFARRSSVRRRAVSIGAVDEAHDDVLAAVREADLVILCVPVLAIPRLAHGCAPALRAGAIVTDVGSTKKDLLAAMERALARRDVSIVGSHPIAGSEAAGIGAARADLYRGSVVVVTPSPKAPPAAVGKVKSFWTALGARVVEMDAGAHDRVLAATSHVPHIVSAALVASVLGRGEKRLAGFCGTGFRDTTRIAAGSEDVWHDIAATNRREIARGLAKVESVLRRTRRDLEKGRLGAVKSFLANSRRLREAMDAGGSPSRARKQRPSTRRVSG